uniref:Putative F-box/kelch-repeat protein n=1 Tax=Noccaea caerulescens TaxID=107243 RepID=A0A1J3HUM9_NOCCA
MGVVDGKMYVFHELKNGSIQEEVLDVESQTWKDAGAPVPDETVHSRLMAESSVTNKVELSKEKLEMPIDNWALCMSVADNVLFACFNRCGLMWLDTKRNIWRMVTGDVQTLHQNCYDSEMAEYYGKLAVFWRGRHIGTTKKNKKKEEKIWCALISWIGLEEEFAGQSGIVATIPYVCQFLHCFVVSD